MLVKHLVWISHAFQTVGVALSATTDSSSNTAAQSESVSFIALEVGITCSLGILLSPKPADLSTAPQSSLGRHQLSGTDLCT